MTRPTLQVIAPAAPRPPKTALQRVAEAARDARAEQAAVALGILALAAEAQAQLTEGAAALDRLPDDVRAEMERTAAMLAVSIARITAGVRRGLRSTSE